MPHIKFLSIFLLLFSSALPWNATAISKESSQLKRSVQKQQHHNVIERMLAQALFQIKQGKTNDALKSIDMLIKKVPNFRLAHVIRGDLLASKAGRVDKFANVSTRDVKQVQGYQDEARTRLENYLAGSKEQLNPNLLIKLSDKQQYAVIIDVSKSRLYLFAKNESDQLKYMADYYVTIGSKGFDKKVEGDKRTPLGVYFASTKLTQQLPDLYGDGAYPLNYPNEIDLYEKRTGSGIWLHGTPSNTYSRAPRASDGCVVLSNQDIKALHPVLGRGDTPVIIAEHVNWKNTANNESEALAKALEKWRTDWLSQNTSRYLSNYSKNFFHKKGHYESWAAHKTRVQASKPKVKVVVSNLSMFSYPNASKPMVVVTFNQHFKSATLDNRMKKRQYWVKEKNQWKIIYEGAA